MLEISPDQLAAFGAESDDRFHARLFAYLCETFPDYAQDRAGVAAVVQAGVADARDAGLRGAQALAIYVIVAFLVGMDIKDHPSFVRNVRMSGASEAEKIDWMTGWLDQIVAGLAR